MSRALWFVVGAGAGVYGMARARRAAEAFTPEGLGDRLSALAVGAHLFGQEVRAGRDEKEAQIRSRLGLDHRPVDGTPQISSTPTDTHTDTHLTTTRGND